MRVKLKPAFYRFKRNEDTDDACTALQKTEQEV
jgi:hypothetical protein